MKKDRNKTEVIFLIEKPVDEYTGKNEVIEANGVFAFFPKENYFHYESDTTKWKSFDSPSHYIKLNKKEVGSIDHTSPYFIRLMVIKHNINEDGNPNCEWKWIRLNDRFKDLEDAKHWLNNNIENITSTYKLFQMD